MITISSSSQWWKEISENKILKIISILPKVVRLIVRDFILRKLVQKLQEFIWIFLFSKHGNREKKNICFLKKRTREIEKIDFRWARQETDHTSLISLFWLPVRLVHNHFRKKYTFCFIIRPIWSFLIIFLRGHLGWRALNW